MGEHEKAGVEDGATTFLKTYGKAIVATVATGCAYLAGCAGDGISSTEWLGLIPFVAAAAGITWAAPSRSTS